MYNLRELLDVSDLLSGVVLWSGIQMALPCFEYLTWHWLSCVYPHLSIRLSWLSYVMFIISEKNQSCNLQQSLVASRVLVRARLHSEAGLLVGLSTSY